MGGYPEQFVDRISGLPDRDAPPGWTGRWARKRPSTNAWRAVSYVLDSAAAAQTSWSESRDSLQPVDQAALDRLTDSLFDAAASESWIDLSETRLLASNASEELELQPRELILIGNLKHLMHVCERFITRLRERDELVPVSRAKRPSRRATRQLAAHTEDWAKRRIAGVTPRRILAVNRELDPDLYENRMVVELLHPILSARLAARIEGLRAIKVDLTHVRRAQDEGTHFRRRRLYRFWGDAVSVDEALESTQRTLDALGQVAGTVQQLRSSPLAIELRGKRTGNPSLRRTNVMENDRHYRAVGKVWRAYKHGAVEPETARERERRLQDRHRAFAVFVLALIVRALEDLKYTPADDSLPVPGSDALVVWGPWGSCELIAHEDDTFSLRVAGRTTRFVPLLDLLAPEDQHDLVAFRWASIRAAALNTDVPVVVVYLAQSRVANTLAPTIAFDLDSPGADGLSGDEGVAGVAVSPLESTSLERLARAVTRALLEPRLETYPPRLTLAGEPIPSRLRDQLLASMPSRRGVSPAFHQSPDGQVTLRRPLLHEERVGLEQTLRSLADQAKRPGWQRDMLAQIQALPGAVEKTEHEVEFVRTCPLCEMVGSGSDVQREGDIFSFTCSGCSTRWGHDRCGTCRARIPVLEVAQGNVNPEVRDFGWVERILGRDALASPCWARILESRFVCPSCGTCGAAGGPAGATCARCTREGAR